MVSRVRKRDGRVVTFALEKIVVAISKAFQAVHKETKPAVRLALLVKKELDRKFSGKVPHVEDIQDVVEHVLLKQDLGEVAKAYILYRHEHAEKREVKELLGVRDHLKLGVNALKVLQARYLQKDDHGRIVETPSQLFRRVAKAVAAADKKHGKSPRKAEDPFFEAMAKQEFMPNSPTLMNAGTGKQMLSACFVLPVGDSLEEIFTSVKNTAKIEQMGGGVGFSFSRLRPKGDIVGTTKGVSSGPLSFMQIFNATTDVIKQGSRRRGAMMGILRVDHPDILQFIAAKQDPSRLNNFNISVAVTDAFMKAVHAGKKYELINPRTQKKAGQLDAREVFQFITTMAWKTGDPGLFFIDISNKEHAVQGIGEIESTNPCGEIPLLPYESCNLGSINVSRLVKNGNFNWERFKELVHLGVHFLDNVIDVNEYPLKEIEEITRNGNRKIGLGIMGFAEMLVQMGIPYNSQKALDFADQLMRFMRKEAVDASARLGKERGPFKNFKYSVWKKKGYQAMRNATILAIAPTGTISIIAETSSSIEPLFALSFVREVLEGAHLFEVNRYFEDIARKMGFYSSHMMAEVSKVGSLRKMKGIPEDVKRLFVTAMDIEPEWHIRMQAVFQKYVDNAVSKTINFPEDATVEDVRKAYSLAYTLKCKGITIYRYGSKPSQVLYIGEKESEEAVNKAHAEFSGGCFSGECAF